MKKDWFSLESVKHLNILSLSDSKIEGVVTKIADGVVTITGLEKATAGEMIKINVKVSSKSKNSNLVYAMVLNLGQDRVEAIILGDESKVKQGDTVERCYFPVQLSVGFHLLGRVIDPLGNFLDTKTSNNFFGNITVNKKVEIKAPGIIERESVTESMETGLKAVDSMVPIGRGQRELIIGDRQTGKSAVAVDAILHQAKKSDYKKTFVISELENDKIENFIFSCLLEIFSKEKKLKQNNNQKQIKDFNIRK